VAIVTGASTGIGRAIAEALVAEGAAVVGAARRAPRDPVSGAEHREVDLAVDGAPAALVADVVRDRGRLDVLVNNAAVAQVVAGFADESLASWHSTMAVNLLAAVAAMCAALPHLAARGGAIVNVSSVNSRMPASEGPSYSASKAALLNATKGVANEYVGRVRANVVSPGLTATPMWLGQGGLAEQLGARLSADPSAIAAEAAADTPLKRFLEPSEIAAAVCFLASPRASAITGADLVVDGGLTPTI
jgi:NAD(P)-dependent dehydrogenase (short-subunit alcohol dehydrogenase family)